MRKINNRKSLILAAGGGKYVPNIVRGGNAIPLGNNFYYIKGRKHSAGGVDIGADPKTGLEVEGEEVMKVTPKEVRVYSSVPFLQGNSPAELVMGGANPDAVFNAQEEFKDRNRINDDGTKYENGGKIYDASKNYERAAKVREWTDAPVGLFDPTPISGVLDIINARNNDRSNAEMVLSGLSVLPGARVLSKLTRGLGRLTKNQSIIKEGKKISDVVNRDKTLQKAISSFNQSARDGTLAEQMRRREIYTPGGDVDLDRIQGEHIKNYNKAIHYFDRYNKLSDSNWANYENFAAASRGINTTVDAYNIGKESVNFVTDENKTNKKKLGGNGRVTNVDGKQSDRYKNDNNNDINQHFVLRSLNRNNVGNNKTVTDILAKDGTAIRFEEAPYSKVDSLVANSIIGDKSLWNAHHLVKSVRAGLTSNPFKYIYNTVENVTNGVYEELLGNIIGKDKAIDVKFHGNINKKPLGGNLPTNQNDFLDTWNASRLATGRYNNQLGDGRLERQAESRNTAREFRSPIGFAMNYGKRAAIRTPKEDEVIDLLNNVAMRNDPNQLNLNNINLNTVPVYAAKYGTKRKSKMGKVISINGNVRNGLIHTPSHEAFAYGGERKPRFNGRYSKPGLHNLSLLASAIIMPKGTVDKEPEKPRRVGWADLHNRLVTADISQKPLDAKRDNTSVAHVISETEKRTRKFNIGGRAKAKVGSGFRINDKKYNVGDTVNYKGQQYLVTDRNEAIPLPDANNNIIDNDIDIPTTNITTPQLTRNIVNGLTNNASTYKKNGETHYFVEAPAVSVPNSNYDMDALQRMILNIPVGTRSNTSSSSTGGNNKQQSVSVPVVSINPLDGSKVMSASDENTAMIRRNLAPTVVNRLTKNANNDINYLSVLDNLKRPYQEDIAKTRNLDNIQFGINLGSSAVDALMSNIFANQLHSYTPPTITAPTISNPGDIKLNEEDLKDIPEPILMAAAKLKTRYNANPQLAKIEDETRRTMRDIDRNTSNSRVGLARKQLAALRGQEAKNQVYAQKENIETELINKDKLNQQEVTARNLARYDQYNQALATQMANRARLRLAADTANILNRINVSTANANLKAQADQFNAGNRINSLIHQAGIDGTKAEARANIVSSLLGNVGSAFDIWNRNKRQAKLDEETLKVLGLRAPNANKLMLRTLGINK